MISNPKHGWCNFKLGSFHGTPSYLTDVPADLLDVFIDYYTKGCGAAVFDEEGSYFTLLITAYNLGIFIIEEKDGSILYDFSMIDIDLLAKELIEDIEKDLIGWSEFITDNDPEEIIVHRATIRRKIIKLKELCKGV